MFDYQADFDIASMPSLPLKTAAMLVVFMIVAVCLVYVTRSNRSQKPGASDSAAPAPLRIFALWIFPFAIGLSALVLALYVGQYLTLLDARLKGRFNVVQGCLTAFRSASDDKGSDYIQVAGRTFAYSGSFEGPSFNQTEARGGPIHADSRVRLGFVGPSIIRVETIRHDCPQAGDFNQ